MKINFLSTLPFGKLNTYRENNINLAENFKCKANSEKVYDVSINKAYDCYNVHILDKKFHLPAAEQDMMIYPEVKYLYVDNMFTDEDYRGEGLGTCLHLSNIIEMFENNLDRVELYSVASAIPFHTKCGFKPQAEWREPNYIINNTRFNIKNIADDNTPELAAYTQKAKELLKSRFSPKLRTRLANKLIYNYTKDAIKIKSVKEQKYMFTSGLNMSLSREDVLKNKDFYNKLFDKYGIDYQISDCCD